MKIILKENMKHVGKQGEVVMFKDGYANNFLFPKRMAVLATPGNIKMMEENNRQGAMKREKMKADALALSDKLKELKLTIGTKAGSNGKIFGSITPLQVSQSLKNLGYEIDRRKIEVDDIAII